MHLHKKHTQSEVFEHFKSFAILKPLNIELNLI